MAVNNCERVKVKVTSTGIENINKTTDNAEVARYTLDGRRISNVQRGLNIVRMANGTTKKIIL